MSTVAASSRVAISTHGFYFQMAIVCFAVGLIGLEPDSRTLRLVREEVGALKDPTERRAAAVALLLGSPEFQRQ